MRLKAILAEAARKRYPLSVMLMIVGVLMVPFPYLFIHFGLELANFWWSALGIGAGIVSGSLMIGLGSLVEDIHDISMHTVGYDLEFGEMPEEDLPEDEDPEMVEEAPGAPDESEDAPEDEADHP